MHFSTWWELFLSLPVSKDLKNPQVSFKKTQIWPKIKNFPKIIKNHQMLFFLTNSSKIVSFDPKVSSLQISWLLNSFDELTIFWIRKKNSFPLPPSKKKIQQLSIPSNNLFFFRRKKNRFFFSNSKYCHFVKKSLMIIKFAESILSDQN